MAAPGSVMIRVNVRTLLIVLGLTVSPLVIDMFLVLDRSRDEFTSVIGDYFEKAAENGASQVSQFVDARVVDVRVLAPLEQISKVTSASQNAARSGSPALESAKLAEINAAWERPDVSALVSKVLGNPSSIFLREYLALNHDFERILVTDARGVTLAASHKPIRYYHGDQRWWIRSFGDGQSGRVHVADVEWDPVSLKNCIAIACPVLGPNGRGVTGILRAFVDVAKFDSLIRNLRVGDSGDAKLVKRDGTVIRGGEPSRSFTEKAEEMEVAGPALAGTVRGSTIGRLRGGRQVFVGYADLTLSRKYPEIDWCMLVTQDFEEVSAPIRIVNSRALASGFLAILIVGALAIYFTTHRPQEMAHMDELLKSQP